MILIFSIDDFAFLKSIMPKRYSSNTILGDIIKGSFKYLQAFIAFPSSVAKIAPLVF